MNFTYQTNEIKLEAMSGINISRELVYLHNPQLATLIKMVIDSLNTNNIPTFVRFREADVVVQFKVSSV